MEVLLNKFKKLVCSALAVSMVMMSGFTALADEVVLYDMSGRKTVSIDYPVSIDLTGYFIGDSFDDNFSRSDTITVNYDDGTYDSVELKESSLIGFDTSTVGDKEAIIRYNGVECAKKFKYTVQEPFKGFKFADNSVKEVYIGDGPSEFPDWDYTCSDDRVKDNIFINESGSMNFLSGLVELGQLDASTAGTKPYSLRLFGNTFIGNIIVKEHDKQINNITVKDVITEYDLDDKFKQSDNQKLVYHFTDGSTREIVLRSDMLTNFSTSMPGQKIVNVSHLGYTTSFTINVSQTREVNNLVLDYDSLRTTYYEDEKITDSVEGKFTAYYFDGHSEVHTFQDSGVTVLAVRVGDIYQIQITYKGANVGFEARVVKRNDTSKPDDIKKNVKSIELGNDVTKKYVKGAKFDGKGTLTVVYDDGTREYVQLEESMLSGFDTSKYGSYVVKVSYGGKETQYTIFVDRTTGTNSSSGGSNSSSSSNSTVGYTKRPTHYGDSRDYSDNKISSSSSFSGSTYKPANSNNSNTNKGFNSKAKISNVPNTGGTWSQSNGVWYYKLKNGRQAKNQWVGNGTDWYWLDKDGKMATGWTLINGSYYLLSTSETNKGACGVGWKLTDTDKKWYFCSTVDGHLCEGWNMIDGKWYYFTKYAESTQDMPAGSMWSNTTTPDGYKVGLNGVWIK